MNNEQRIKTNKIAIDEDDVKLFFNNRVNKRTRNSLRNIVSPKQDLTFSQLKIYYEEKGFDINNNLNIHLIIRVVTYRISYYVPSQNILPIRIHYCHHVRYLSIVFGNRMLKWEHISNTYLRSLDSSIKVMYIMINIKPEQIA